MSLIALAGLAVTMPAFAADAPATTTSPSTSPTAAPAVDPTTGDADIIVTGLRRSLLNAQAIKQNSDVVVDSISSEDIGALPDRSVTEALSRIPGVTISRFAAGVDPDHFSVEGSGVTVRGLSYTRSELNGRDTFTANNGRSLSFADVPAELLAGVDVFKSPTAESIEGGIAGTVNLRTRLPFDTKGFLAAGTIEGNYGDFKKKWAPSVSVLVSDRWETGIGEFGILASFVRTELYSRADGLQLSNWGTRGQTAAGVLVAPTDPTSVKTVYVPRGAAMRSQDFDRTRYGYSAAAQWRSNDESMSATFQFLRSDSREAWTEHAVEIATDNVTSNGDAQPYPGTKFTFDDQNVFTGGIITAPNGYRADQWGDASNVRTPVNGLQSNNITRNVNQRFVTDDYGFNFTWKVSDRLGVKVDLQHVNSKVNNLDYGIWTSSFQNVDIRTNGNDPATVSFLPLQNPGATLYQTPPHTGYLDPYNTFYRSAMDHIEESTGHENAARIDLDYAFPENDWLASVRAGYRYSDRENEARFSSYNWGVLSEIWGGSGPIWLDTPLGTGGKPGPSEPFAFNNFFQGDAASPANAGRLFVPVGVVADYAAGSALATQVGNQWRTNLVNGCPQNWVPLAQRCGVVAGTPFLPGEINPISEKTHAFYGEVRFDHRLSNDWRLTGNFGARYVDTTRIASGVYSYPVARFDCTVAPPPAGSPPQPPTPFCALGATVVANANKFQNGALTPINANLGYHYVLPSMNAKLDVGHGLQFRVAYNKSIAPPDFGLTRAYYNIQLSTSDQTIATNGAPIAIFNVGNPYLKPIRSDNFDLTAEWYFSPVGQLTLSLFAKNLKGVLTNGTERLTFTNNGATFGALVTTPSNATDTGRVKGAELGYQQVFSFLPGVLRGLGLAGNFTWIDSHGVRQSTLSATDPDVAAGNVSNVDTSKLSLQGLSKYAVNIQPFYQLGKLEVRAAYSWRSAYLLTPRDVIVPFAPIFNEATGQLDASIFYQVTPNFRVGAQGTNLLNEVLETTQVINNDLVRRPRSWFVNDRRLTLSARFKFN